MKFIPLNAFLKMKEVASSGGEAKHFIKEGFIKLNGVVETQNKKKLVVGDVIEIDGTKVTVLDTDIRD